MSYVTRKHLSDFTEKLLINDKKIRDELKDEISKLPSKSIKVDNDTITMNDEGVISSKQYTLPTASNSELGGVKVDGTTITIDSEGVISASAESVDVATTDKAGIVKPDGTSITVDLDGTIHATTDTNQIKQDIKDYMTEHPVSAEVGNKSVKKEKLSDDVATLFKANKVLCAQTVADINLLPITPGSVVKTLGFNRPNDGGGATYIIKDNSESLNLLKFNNTFYRFKSDEGEYGTISTYENGDIVINGVFKNVNVAHPLLLYTLPIKSGTQYTFSATHVSGTCENNAKGMNVQSEYGLYQGVSIGTGN